jgi:hypothetical protein
MVVKFTVGFIYGAVIGNMQNTTNRLLNNIKIKQV